MELTVHIRKKLGSFTLESDLETGGELLSLLGPSGCGKSMTLKCIAGIEKPDEGRITLGSRILFDSEKKINLPPQQRRVGYMFQDYALFPNMTVRQNVLAGMHPGRAAHTGQGLRDADSAVTGRSRKLLPVRSRRPDPSAADALLEKFRIANLADRLPRELSGGQKQRVAMARIAAQDPDVILMDEPFSAMDTVLRWELQREMLDMLKSAGKPVLFVSHDLDEVYRMGGNVCTMEEGKTGAIVSTGRFFEDLKNGNSQFMPGWKVIPPE